MICTIIFTKNFGTRLTWASLPACGWAEPSRYFVAVVVPLLLWLWWRWLPIVCWTAAFILFMMPPEPPCMLPLPLLLSLSEPDALAASRSFFFVASDFVRGRKTSNIVGLRFGLAIPIQYSNKYVIVQSDTVVVSTHKYYVCTLTMNRWLNNEFIVAATPSL